MSALKTYPVRLTKGQELKESLISIAKDKRLSAPFILTCCGSVSCATLRFAKPENGSEKVRIYCLLTIDHPNHNFQLPFQIGTTFWRIFWNLFSRWNLGRLRTFTRRSRTSRWLNDFWTCHGKHENLHNSRSGNRQLWTDSVWQKIWRNHRF